MDKVTYSVAPPTRLAYLFCLCGLLALFALLSAPAKANSKYAAYIIHADSGDVLFDRYSTQPRYPASLTKMMTVYLLFEELEAGRLTLKSKLRVSKTAAAQPPSKLGVGAGTTIDVETAIKALLVKSANDVAVVVAEKIGGSEWKFAKKMTTKAKKLGMHKTTFRNASGLPHSRQLTTARDMAELSRRLIQDFPQYRHYFSTKSFVYKKRTYTTHNSLVKNYPGADGLKTGYTRRSGYNLATSAVRDDNRLIGIVLGGRSSYTRDKHMREILDKAFATIKTRPSLISSLHTNPPAPRLKPSPYEEAPTIANNPALQASLGLSAESFSHSSTHATGGLTGNDPVASLLATGTISSLAPLSPSSSDLNRAQTRALESQERNTPDRMAQLINREDNSYTLGEGDYEAAPTHQGAHQASHALGNLPFSVQIGAYSTDDYARKQLDKASKLAGLETVDRQIIPLQSNNKTVLYRARFFFQDRQSANTGCKTLKTKGVGCFVTNEPANQF